MNPVRSEHQFNYPLSVAMFNHSKPQRTLRGLINDVKLGKLISAEEIKVVSDSYNRTTGKVLLSCALSDNERLKQFAVDVFSATNDPFISGFLSERFKKAVARKSRHPETFEKYLHFLERVPVSHSRDALWQLVDCKDCSPIEKSKGIKAQVGKIDESKYQYAKSIYRDLYFATGISLNDDLVRARKEVMEGLKGASLPFVFTEFLTLIESGFSYSQKQFIWGAYTYDSNLQKQLHSGEVQYKGFAIDDISIALKGSITDAVRAQKIVKLFESVREIVESLEKSREKSITPYHLEFEHGRQLKRGYLILNALIDAMSKSRQPLVKEYLEKLIGDQDRAVYWVGLDGAPSAEAATEVNYVVAKAACCDVTGYIRWRSAFALYG